MYNFERRPFPQAVQAASSFVPIFVEQAAATRADRFGCMLLEMCHSQLQIGKQQNVTSFYLAHTQERRHVYLNTMTEKRPCILKAVAMAARKGTCISCPLAGNSTMPHEGVGVRS